MKKIRDSQELGILVCRVRKEQRLTQAQLAAVCGVGIRFVRELEHGKKTCQLEKALQVARMLGIEIFAKRRGDSIS